jgi:hypothetical protein
LREKNLLTLVKGTVQRIHDLAGLRKLAGYQGGYLDDSGFASWANNRQKSDDG